MYAVPWLHLHVGLPLLPLRLLLLQQRRDLLLERAPLRLVVCRDRWRDCARLSGGPRPRPRPRRKTVGSVSDASRCVREAILTRHAHRPSRARARCVCICICVCATMRHRISPRATMCHLDGARRRLAEQLLHHDPARLACTRRDGSVARKVWASCARRLLRNRHDDGGPDPRCDSPINVTQRPERPARAVRPTRWMYVESCEGISRLMTVCTPGMSSPRAAMSVQRSMSASCRRNLSSASSRCGCVRFPWS